MEKYRDVLVFEMIILVALIVSYASNISCEMLVIYYLFVFADKLLLADMTNLCILLSLLLNFYLGIRYVDVGPQCFQLLCNENNLP